MLAALSGASADLPFVGLDIIVDGPRSFAGSFMRAAGAKVANAYGVFPTGTDPTLGPQVEAQRPGDLPVRFGMISPLVAANGNDPNCWTGIALVNRVGALPDRYHAMVRRPGRGRTVKLPDGGATESCIAACY